MGVLPRVRRRRALGRLTRPLDERDGPLPVREGAVVVCGQLVVAVAVASTRVPAEPETVVPDAVVVPDVVVPGVVVPPCALPDVGPPVPPSAAGLSPDEAGGVDGSGRPSLFSGAGFGSLGAFVTSGADEPEPGEVAGPSELDPGSGPGTSASLR